MAALTDHLTRQETLNYWKQLPHILKYFRAEEDPNARRPQNFMSGFLEVWPISLAQETLSLIMNLGTQLNFIACTYIRTNPIFSVPFYAVQCSVLIALPPDPSARGILPWQS